MDCFLEPRHQPVLPNPPPVVLLCPAPHHRLLLYTAGISLDQVSFLRLTPEGGVSGPAAYQRDRHTAGAFLGIPGASEGLRGLTSDFLQVRRELDHDDQGLHILDLHGADPALPWPHQVHITTSSLSSEPRSHPENAVSKKMQMVWKWIQIVNNI